MLVAKHYILLENKKNSLESVLAASTTVLFVVAESK